jgi:hypothetical protein
MTKNYFELDKVNSITLTMEKESGYKWFSKIPAKPKTFLGIRYGMEPEIPAGWNQDIDDDGKEYRPWWRKQSSYFEDYKWYKVDEVNKKIFIKPHVEIRFGYKQSIGQNFNSNEEAQSWVDELIQSSDKQFHVIINK